MKKNSSRLPLLCLVGSALCAPMPVSLAQSAPTLALNLYPGVSITGTVGAVYALQATTDLGQTNGWSCVALVQLPSSNYVWVDTSQAATTGLRFFRAALSATGLVAVLPGTFTMGSPATEASRNSDEPQHVVTISRGFWMGKYPVTQGDYLNVVGTNPSHFTPANGYTNDLTSPAEQVSWVDATNYCALLTRREMGAGLIPPHYAYRLPTESEWEYACRAGTTTAFWWGSVLTSGEGLANFDGTEGYDAAKGWLPNPSGISLQATTSVLSYEPNGWGLSGMSGNVWEWCQDWYGPYPGAVTDPQGAVSGVNRVFRGGSWHDAAWFLRSAMRGSNEAPSYRDSHIGFRVVLAAAQP